MSVTLDDLLTCLGEVTGPAEGYRTRAEWAKALGVSEGRVRSLMLSANERGRLLVRHESRPALDGRAAKVPVYSFVTD